MYIKTDDFMKEVLYGYSDGEKSIVPVIRPLIFLDAASQDRIDAERYDLGDMSEMSDYANDEYDWQR